MKMKSALCAMAVLSTAAALAAGPGGTGGRAGGGMGGGTGGGASGVFAYDAVISVTTNADASISRDGCVIGFTASATTLKPGAAIAEIADGVFAGHTALTSVDLTSSSVTEIPPDCFAGCTSLTTVTLPSSVTKIGTGAFAACSSLVRVVGPGVTEIGEDAFRDCTSLATIPDTGLSGIGTCAYANCPGLSYTITFVRNDGSGKLCQVTFPYAQKTRIPSLSRGLGWARRAYTFKGWETTTARARDNSRSSPWKADWAYVSAPVGPGGGMFAYARWELNSGCYQIRFNKNDGTGRWRTLGFARDTSVKLSTIAALDWTRLDGEFVGWGSNAANATAGKVWKSDGAWVKNAADEGKTLSIYAIWE